MKKCSRCSDSVEYQNLLAWIGSLNFKLFVANWPAKRPFTPSQDHNTLQWKPMQKTAIYLNLRLTVITRLMLSFFAIVSLNRVRSSCFDSFLSVLQP